MSRQRDRFLFFRLWVHTLDNTAILSRDWWGTRVVAAQALQDQPTPEPTPALHGVLTYEKAAGDSSLMWRWGCRRRRDYPSLFLRTIPSMAASPGPNSKKELGSGTAG